MSSDEKFRASLVLGEIAEEAVLAYLLNNNSLVQDMRKQAHEDNKGPRLRGTEGEIVLPDFSAYNKNPAKGKFAIDAKYKNSVYTVNGVKCFTVDDKYEDYKLATQILGLDFLMMAFMFEDRLYFYKDVECIGVTQFSPNGYGNGKAYLFEYNKSKIRY